MSAPRVGVEDVGTFWLGPDGEVWRVITYCEHPTVSWERLADGTRKGGAVGSLITEGFRRLVPETETS